MLLQRRNAIVYGGGGALGGAVARAFAREGATVHLVGRTQSSLDKVADGIRAAGGSAETAPLDAFDEDAVVTHAASVAERFGSVDISFSLIAHPEHLGKPVVQMAYEDFESTVTSRLRATWISVKAAAPHMVKQGSGVILTFGGYGNPVPNYGGFQVAFGAVEAMRRTLAVELGRHGVRVITLQTGGVPETVSDDESDKMRQAITKSIEEITMLGKAATLEDVGNAAVFAASDWARTLTATKLNMTGGTIPD
jgi:3-oxoacyl-[acyl-carrier protein] reductase